MLKKLFKNEKNGQPRAGFLGAEAGEQAEGVAQAAVANAGAVVSENAKLADLLAALDAFKESEDLENSDATQAAMARTLETIADDSELPADVAAKISQEEALVREVLQLFEVDYDALIKLDETSAYGQVVAANPTVLQTVAAAKSPVLAALKIAVSAQPYVEFIRSYGHEPEAIKTAMKAEFDAEVRGKSRKQAEGESDVSGLEGVLPFSYGKSGGEQDFGKKSGQSSGSLAEVFGK